MCAVFNSLRNVKCHKIVVVTSCQSCTCIIYIQVHIDVAGFGGVLYHHFAASFANCIDVGIKLLWLCSESRCSCEFNNCIYLYLRSITERHIILVGQLH